MGTINIEKIDVYTALLQQIFMRRGLEVVHKYFGSTTPFRWEIRRPGSNEWLGTIEVHGGEIIQLCNLPTADQGAYLLSKLVMKSSSNCLLDLSS